jgi:hypothetical protein
MVCSLQGPSCRARRAGEHDRPTVVRARRLALVLAGSAAAALAGGGAPVPALAATGSAQLRVIPEPAGRGALSYFKLRAARGIIANAGRIGLHNAGREPVTVLLTPVAGQTIDTLGSTYAAANARAGAVASWLVLGTRRLVVAPGARATVPVSVLVPRRAPAGDHLAGVSVEALGQRQEAGGAGEAVASVVRYVIGAEVTVPGPRRPGIVFTGARVERQPSALTFLLLARNSGNVILPGVHGAALVTRGRRTVARLPLGPGTFVTSSRIAYPVPAPSEHASEGTIYRVRAYLIYQGGIARLDTLVRFGHRAAVRQGSYAAPHPHRGGGSGLPTWLLGVLGVALLYGLAMTLILVLMRRRRREAANPVPMAGSATAVDGSGRDHEQDGSRTPAG